MSEKSLQEKVDQYLRADTEYRIELERGLGKRMQSIADTGILERGRRFLEEAREKGMFLPDEPETGAAFEPCDVCGGLGMIGTGADFGDPDFGKLIPCPAEGCDFARATRVEQLKKRVGQSKLPDLLQDMTFDNFDEKYNRLIRRDKNIGRFAAEEFALNEGHWVNMPDVLKMAAEHGEYTKREYSYEPRNSLVFFGDMGSGKTGFAASIANYLLAQGEACLYMRCRDMISDVMLERRALGREDDFGNQAWHQRLEDTIKDYPLLLIDEANIVDNKESRDQFFEDLIRHRYMHKLPTVVTCNIDEDGWEREWGGRTTAAMKAMAHWIPVDGVDLRKLS